MLQIQYVWSSPIGETTQAPLSPLTCERPHRLRLYLVGSPADTQQEILLRKAYANDCLHLLRYAERFEWSRAVSVAENGVIIRPDPGDVLRYLQRDR